MEIEHHPVIRPGVVQVVLHGEPIPLKVHEAVPFFPLGFCKLLGKKLVIEDKEDFQVRLSIKVIIYFVYRIHFFRYFWLLALGLSGFVISKYPASTKEVT